MTNIEFRTHIADKIHYTCRWVRKALANSSDCRVVIYATDRNLLNRLDDTLWTFSDSDFLPHAVLGDRHAARCPVILTSSDTDELPHSQILLNLSPDIPAFYAQFERLLELVSTDPADTEAGRQRYVHYRERGYTLHHETAK
ncbi:DNA polymerase III subunit chi [Oxalobacter formigenes]|jgi:DNA polymerase III chi subunit|uniref:Putative DNA polymerase III subunit chi n=1 Tax=Oxalobacter formigenes OXCC13 TaxID=556269 RepID=C3XBL1_OXAFO|nr:DNA polymerase III subunit chi [Oxalobacter formigenes]ARQ45244.1 DNA polymerase III subunit chi [Oxalobacter formigenes]ARQ77543.1 DNA polymerase III subunit chi [Oxalobacter formigenes OXCC13]EEO30587.1 putative DNA polymerase III subunit chi [Oxalobacter formigenes OXCC13]MCZ4062440.1 DNA polymerase III subunit chi [Oxalobacter formigenes]QDX33918.1 DNA polymerase III subunit chi [Oxalobacter formigenes]